MREASAEVIFFWIYEDLCFVLEAAKCLRVQNAIAVTLKGSPHRVGSLRARPPLRERRLCCPLG